MANYRVIVHCLSHEIYEVEAASEEEARGIVERGEATMDGDEPQEWGVEKVELLEA